MKLEAPLAFEAGTGDPGQVGDPSSSSGGPFPSGGGGGFLAGDFYRVSRERYYYFYIYRLQWRHFDHHHHHQTLREAPIGQQQQQPHFQRRDHFWRLQSYFGRPLRSKGHEDAKSAASLSFPEERPILFWRLQPSPETRHIFRGCSQALHRQRCSEQRLQRPEPQHQLTPVSPETRAETRHFRPRRFTTKTLWEKVQATT